MSFKLLYCALFGHSWNERWEKSEPYKGLFYRVESGKRCECCKMCQVDISGSLGLYEAKYNNDESKLQLATQPIALQQV